MSAAASIIGVAFLLSADAGVVTPLPAPPRTAPPLPAHRGPPQLDPSLLVAPAPAGSTAMERERRYDLRPARDGTGDLLYEGPGYVARVKTDGTVRFKDKGGQFNHGLSLIPFMPLGIPGNPPTLQGFAVDLLSRKRKAPPKRGPSPRDAPDPPLPVPNMSRYRPDPREACRPNTPCFFGGDAFPATVAGQFDMTDEILRFHGKDPYRYDKALFLGGTRELRVGMAVRAMAANVRRAAAELDTTLVEVGCDETRSLAERRAILSALRAELDGETPAARAAVGKIDRFVAVHFDAAPDGGVVPCDVSR